MAQNVQNGSESQVATKLCHHGLIMKLVKKKLEKNGIAWEVFLKELWATGSKEPASTSASKKRKAETLSPVKHWSKGSWVQAEKRVVENTPPAVKKRKIRSSERKKVVGQGTNQSGSPILIDDLPQVSPAVHNLSVLADAVAHTVEDEENAEHDVLFSIFVSRLRSRKTMLTPNTSEVQVEEDEEEQHEEPPYNFSELDVETL